MKRLILTVTILASTILSVAIYARRGSAPPEITTAVVSRGSIVKVVSASGTLEAVETVDIGAQVSGSVQSLSADFNSIVRKGQVLARLDPSLIQVDIVRAEASLRGAEAERDRLRVTLDDTAAKVERARALAARQLIPQSDLDAADIAQQVAAAQVRAAEAQIKQASAALTQSRVNLAKTVIRSPIDGIVISRAVDVGQTVAASLQAPTLFTIAADLSQMQVNANIDESDVGGIHEGQPVTFRVDAYPNATYRGTIKQVRLNPTIEQNVVTYDAIVSAPNADLTLKPGMTANISIEVARRDDVLRVPASALRVRPSADVLAKLGGASPSTTPASRGPAAADRGTVWVYEENALRSVPVKTGVTDGTFTEVVDGALKEGSNIATRVQLAGAASGSASPSPSGTGNPLMGGGPPRRF